MKKIAYSTILIFLTVSASVNAGKSSIDYTSKSQLQKTQKLASPKLTGQKTTIQSSKKQISQNTPASAASSRKPPPQITSKTIQQNKTLQNSNTNQYRKNTVNPQSVYIAPGKTPAVNNRNSSINNNKALQNRNANQYRNNVMRQNSMNRDARKMPSGNNRGTAIPGTSNGLTKQYGNTRQVPGAPAYGFGSNRNTNTPGGRKNNASTSTGFGSARNLGIRPEAPDMRNPMESGRTGGIDIVEHNDSMTVPVPAGSANLPVMGRTTRNTTPGGIPIIEHTEKDGVAVPAGSANLPVMGTPTRNTTPGGIPVIEHTAKDGVATPAGSPTLPIMTSPTGQVLGNTSRPPVMGASTGPMGNTNTGLTAEATVDGGKKYSDGRVVDAGGRLISGEPVGTDGNKVFDGRGNMAVAGDGFSNIVSSDGKSIKTVDAEGNVRAVFSPTDSTSDTPRGKKDGPSSSSPDSGSGNSDDDSDSDDSGGDQSSNSNSSSSSNDDNSSDDDGSSSDDSSDDSGSEESTADSGETGGDEGTEGGDDERSEGTGGGANDGVDAYLQSLAEQKRLAGQDEDNSDSKGCGITGQMGPGGGDCTSRKGKSDGYIATGDSTIDDSMVDVRPTVRTFGRGGTGPGDCFKPQGCDQVMDRSPTEYLGDAPVVNPGGY